jgi:hypothetical protein
MVRIRYPHQCVARVVKCMDKDGWTDEDDYCWVIRDLDARTVASILKLPSG